MFPHLISSLLRGAWLIEPGVADSYLPLVLRILAGEDVKFGEAREEGFLAAAPTGTAFNVSRYSALDEAPKGSIALLNIRGPITRYGGMCSYGLEDHIRTLADVDSSNNFIGAVLNINSGGGEASGTGAMADALREFSKPVLGVVVDGMAASAAYWLGSATDELYATTAHSSFGSIGGFVRLMDISKRLEKDGVKIHEIYAPQSTDKNRAVREALDGKYEGMQEHLREGVDAFIDAVKEYRGDKLNLKAGDPFTGKMFTAKKAMEIGMIDGIQSFTSVVRRVEELSKQRTKSTRTTTPMSKNNPQYASIATAAGWEAGHESTEDGLHLTHDDAAAVNSALEAGAAAATRITELEGAATTATDRISQLEQELTAANTARETAEASRDEWKAKADEYGAGAANDGTTVLAEEDENIEEAPAGGYSDVTSEAMQIFKMFNPGK